MIKRLLFTIPLLLSFIACFAQSRCGKGSWYFGISPGSYDIVTKARYKTFMNDTLVRENSGKAKGFILGYNLNAGYFFKKNLCLGMGLFGANNSWNNSLFGRYYFMKKQKCFSFLKQDNNTRSSLFIQGMLHWSYIDTDSDVTESGYNQPTVALTYNSTMYSYGIQGALGYTIMIRNQVALELTTFYNNRKSFTRADHTANGIKFPQQKGKNANEIFGASIGFQVYFN